MDALDKKIVELLSADGKMTVAQIAAEVNRSTTPVHERIKRLEGTGVIIGYSAVVDWKKMGQNLTAFCEVSLQSHEYDHLMRFEERVQSLSEIIECHHIAGSFDYLLKIRTADIESYQRFISEKLATVPHIGKLQTAFAMKEIKGAHRV